MISVKRIALREGTLLLKLVAPQTRCFHGVDGEGKKLGGKDSHRLTGIALLIGTYSFLLFLYVPFGQGSLN